MTVSAISGDTDESGTTATFTVVLTSQPSDEVTIPILSGDPSEGTVDQASLTFTGGALGNWNVPQTVTVTGVDDALVDGNITYSVSVGDPASTGDSDYDGLSDGDTVDASVTNTDNDSAGVTVSAISGDTDESGTTATFTVVLTSQPSDDVTIPILSGDPSEGTVDQASLTFTGGALGNWNVPQTVTVTGVDDALVDGNITYSVSVGDPASTGDSDYDGLSDGDTADVSVTNTDNDSAGVTVSAISGDTDESGTTATFTVVLTSQPSDDVTIPILSGDPSEGTVDQASLTFTGGALGNWNVPQTVTVTGVDDALVDGNITYSVSVGDPASTGDSDYDGLSDGDTADVSVTNTDNDSAGVTVSAISGDTDESGTTATFTVVLTSQPSDDVTIPILSGDPSEGTVDQASLTFTGGALGNWNVPQTVTVTGVDDALVDGNITYSVSVGDPASTGDSDYDGLSDGDTADVSVTNTDNDSAGVTVSAISGDTDESGTTATFTVVLTSQPSDDVTIPILSGDPSEGTVDQASLTFTGGALGNWNVPQTVTVTGVDDALVDGNITYSVSVGDPASTGDSDYDGLSDGDTADVSVTNTDNDSAGVTVSAISGDTDESGTTATFTVVLTSQPSDDVTIPILSGDPSEGTVDQASLTFTGGALGNWNVPQTVTVTGVDDALVDGNITYSVSVGDPASTGDSDYDGLSDGDTADVSVTNTDNDSAGVTVWLSAATPMSPAPRPPSRWCSPASPATMSRSRSSAAIRPKARWIRPP